MQTKGQIRKHAVTICFLGKYTMLIIVESFQFKNTLNKEHLWNKAAAERNMFITNQMREKTYLWSQYIPYYAAVTKHADWHILFIAEELSKIYISMWNNKLSKATIFLFGSKSLCKISCSFACLFTYSTECEARNFIGSYFTFIARLHPHKGK